MAQVSSQEELQQALTSRAQTIEVTGDFQINSQVNIGYEVTITSGPGTRTFTLQKTDTYGSYMFRINPGGSLRLRQLILDGNSASHPAEESTNRSLIYLYGGTLDIGSGTVLQNNNTDKEGGGVYLSGLETSPSRLIMSGDAVITGCHSNSSGGAIMAALRNADDLLSLSDTVKLRSNSALNGGGIYFRSYVESLGGTLEIGSQVEISGNSAVTAGGGIYITSYQSEISPPVYLILKDQASIFSNSALYGGGLFNNRGAVVSIMGDAQIGLPIPNTATQFAPGIYNAGVLNVQGGRMLQNGVYIRDRDSIVSITGALSPNSVIQLDASNYVIPNSSGSPIVVGEATDGYPLLTEQDSAAFRKPAERFDDWEIRLSGDRTQVLLVPAQEEIIFHALTYHANDDCCTPACGIPAPVMFQEGQDVTLSSLIPSRCCGCFVGWNTGKDGSGATYWPGSVLTAPDGDVNLYAQWRCFC